MSPAFGGSENDAIEAQEPRVEVDPSPPILIEPPLFQLIGLNLDRSQSRGIDQGFEAEIGAPRLASHLFLIVVAVGKQMSITALIHRTKELLKEGNQLIKKG